MNGTTGTADLLSGRFDARQRESECDEPGRSVRQLLQHNIEWVSSNLGVYFSLCLFGLAILARFL